MKIGIISEGYAENNQEGLSECDNIIILTAEKDSTAEFLQVINTYLAEEIIVPAVSDLGLQLVQLLPSLKLLAMNGNIIHFIQKDQGQLLTDEAYFQELYELALLEERIIKKRTVEAIKRAQEKGVTVGRPTIDERVKEKIYMLYTVEKRTIREISAICNVSIGTAFKYAKN